MTHATETKADPEAGGATGRVLTISLRRIRHGRAVAFASEAPEIAPRPKPRPSRAAQMLALAHEFQRLLDEGEVPDRATLAAQVGLTRARITQIMDLLLLAPDIQEAVLTACGLISGSLATERRLRNLARLSSWAAQRATRIVGRPQVDRP